MKTYFFIVSLMGSVVLSAQQMPNKKSIDSLKKIPIRLVSDNYYNTKLGFICKKEWQVEKLTKVPFKIRLGSVDYVDKLEGKGTGKN